MALYSRVTNPIGISIFCSSSSELFANELREGTDRPPYNGTYKLEYKGKTFGWLPCLTIKRWRDVKSIELASMFCVFVVSLRLESSVSLSLQ
jgi:hypothetical protein